MHIKFGFGKKGLASADLKYTVENYAISLSSDPKFAKGYGDFIPGNIAVTIEINPREQPELMPPVDDLIAFGKTQQDGYKDCGAGKMEVRTGVGQKLIQTIEFEEAYLENLAINSSSTSDMFIITLAIHANKIKMGDHDIERKK